MIKLMMECARYAAHMKEIIYAYKILVGKPQGNRPLRRLGINGRIIVKWILQEQGG
jgi:hypothetical protein